MYLFIGYNHIMEANQGRSSRKDSGSRNCTAYWLAFLACSATSPIQPRAICLKMAQASLTGPSYVN